MYLLFCFLLLINTNFASTISDTNTIPTTCNNLLPDIDPYLNFMNDVASLWIDTNIKMSKKIFKVLAYANLYNIEGSSSDNPIFYLIKNNLCKAFELNNNTIFTSNSQTIRKYLQDNIDRMLKISKEEYLKLKTKNYLSLISEKKLKQNAELISRTKEKAHNEALKEAFNEFNKFVKKKN
jgi:hypothetical protein